MPDVHHAALGYVVTKAKNIKPGDHIRHGKVTRVTQRGPARPIEIDWSRGSKSGVMVRSPWLGVKRVYSAPPNLRARRGKK
jgi:hypothetical protein